MKLDQTFMLRAVSGLTDLAVETHEEADRLEKQLQTQIKVNQEERANHNATITVANDRLKKIETLESNEAFLQEVRQAQGETIRNQRDRIQELEGKLGKTKASHDTALATQLDRVAELEDALRQRNKAIYELQAENNRMALAIKRTAIHVHPKGKTSNPKKG